MSTQETSARTRSRLATAVVALALTAAVLVVASQASEIGSTRIGPQVPRVPAQTALTVGPGLQTSIHIRQSCQRRKFGCGQESTTTADPELRTSIHSSKGCWLHKFTTFSRSALSRCGQDATIVGNSP